MHVIRPQPGPQEKFLATPADIAIYGGAAGGGKTWALLTEALRHINNPSFGAVFLRRTFSEITMVGGMWEEADKLYPLLGAVPNQGNMFWRFPKGAKVQFHHMQHEESKQLFLGAQIPLIGFDQLERFTESQFFYMLSRNRSTCGVRPYVRATANPEPGWLAKFLTWWIDQDTGFPIAERAGKIRWFTREAGVVRWADNPKDLEALTPGTPPKSVTFIPAKLSDNKILMAIDPGYKSNLLALPFIERSRLLDGNWKISNAKGEWPPEYFGSSIWFDEYPKNIVARGLALDPSKGKNAKTSDYSAYVGLSIDQSGMGWIEADLQRRPVRQIVEDGFELTRQTPYQVVGVESEQFQELLLDEFARVAKERGRMLPLCGIRTQGVAKEVRIRRLGPYLSRGEFRFRDTPGTRLLVEQLQAFPNGEHDDGPDGLDMAVRLVRSLLEGHFEDQGIDYVRG